MTCGSRIAALAIGVLAVAGGALLLAFAGSGWGLVAIGLLVIASVAFEPRYKRLRDGRPANASPEARWQPTGEREVDGETGALVEVWFDPLTGERTYVALDPAAGRPALR